MYRLGTAGTVLKIAAEVCPFTDADFHQYRPSDDTDTSSSAGGKKVLPSPQRQKEVRPGVSSAGSASHSFGRCLKVVKGCHTVVPCYVYYSHLPSGVPPDISCARFGFRVCGNLQPGGMASLVPVPTAEQVNSLI